MTENEWLNCKVPKLLLDELGCGSNGTAAPAISTRQLRLFSCACCRMSGTSSDVVDTYELNGPPDTDDPDPHSDIDWAYGWTENGRSGVPPLSLRASILRDIVKNPWLSTRPLWTQVKGVIREKYKPIEEWLTDVVISLAEGAFMNLTSNGTLDPLRLLILADAMEESGCDDEVLLSHLRDTATKPHVRGCWVLDALLRLE